MSVVYYPLWDYLNRHGKKKTDLWEILSPRTVAKLSKNEVVTTETLDKICQYLKCDISDVCEVKLDEVE